MKKFLCMLLCVLLLGSLAAQAFAVTVVNGEVTEDGVVFDLPYNGLRLSFPPEFEDMAESCRIGICTIRISCILGCLPRNGRNGWISPAALRNLRRKNWRDMSI